MSAQSVAVIGLGGIGGVAAAALQLAGRHDVLACARQPLAGLTFRHPEGTVELPLRCLADPAELAAGTAPGTTTRTTTRTTSGTTSGTTFGAAPVDWILLCTKAQDTAAAGPWLSGLAGPGTRVAVLQNGLGHAERVAPFVNGAPVVPVIVYYNGERTAPGQVQLRRLSKHDMAVPNDAHGHAFAALLEGSVLNALPAADFAERTWRKLLLNIVANPLTAITRQRQHVLWRPDMQELGSALLAEAVAVARAEGVALGPEAVAATWDLLRHVPSDAGTSMYHDTMAGRKLEAEALTGALVAAAERHGISTPLNRAMLSLLRAISDAAG